MNKMVVINELETSRLRLRQWQESDFPQFAQLNADPDVMRYFPATLSENESNAMANKIQDLIQTHGWGFWAVEVKNQHQFIGFVGLNAPQDDLPFTPCTEIGWRLAKNYWGMGYAQEAAKAALGFGFDNLGLDKIYAFTSVQNYHSENLMKRLGMQNTQQNFYHPRVPSGHRLQEHLLYEISKTNWFINHQTTSN